jgi:hypothetical protein
MPQLIFRINCFDKYIRLIIFSKLVNVIAIQEISQIKTMRQ